MILGQLKRLIEPAPLNLLRVRNNLHNIVYNSTAFCTLPCVSYNAAK